MALRHILLFGAVFLALIRTVLGAAEVRLTQETPCVTGRPCVLKCSVVSGQNEAGLVFSSIAGQVVSCRSRNDCKSEFSTWYNVTLTDNSTTSLQIGSFTVNRDQGYWTCRENSLNSTNSTIYVQENVPPSGVTFGRTCDGGRVTSPAFLNCSLDNPGVPPATLSLVDSSHKTIGSSQTGSVTGNVTTSGLASCSVTWSAFPSFPLNITPVLCDVQVFPSASAVGVLNMTVREGQSVTLTCEAKGYPMPKIAWSHRGTSTHVNVTDTERRGNLTLTPDRSGGVSQRVTCIASNPAGSAVVSFSLSLQYPPPGPPAISGLPPDGVVIIGDEVMLTCNVSEANPPVSNVTLTCPRHSNTSQGDVTSLEFTAGRRDQGSCVCSAFHVLRYSLTASLSLNVLANTCDHAVPVAITFFVTLGVSVIVTLLVTYLCCRRHRNGQRDVTDTQSTPQPLPPTNQRSYQGRVKYANHWSND